MKFTNVIIYIMVLLSINAYAENRSDTEIIYLIKSNHVLYKNNDKNLGILSKLNFLDKLVMIDNKVVNGMIYVETEKGIKGWIEEKFTSFIPDSWMRFNKIMDVDIWLPDQKELKFIQGGKGGLKNQTMYENKIFYKDYFITVSIILKEFNKYFEVVKNDEQFPNRVVDFNKIYLKDIVGYYFSNTSLMDGRTGYSFIGGNNKSYSIYIGSINKQIGGDELFVMYKILFSLSLKKENIIFPKEVSLSSFISITGNFINMRKEPNTKSQVLHHLSDGEKVDFIQKSEHQDEIGGEKHYWYNIGIKKSGNYIQGWVYGKFIKILDGK